MDDVFFGQFASSIRIAGNAEHFILGKWGNGCACIVHHDGRKYSTFYLMADGEMDVPRKHMAEG